MPLIDDFNPKKTFKRKAYRPWDTKNSNSEQANPENIIDLNTISNQSKIDSQPIQNQFATDSKPNRNQTETNSESNRNQFATDSKPIRNQSETNPESIQNQFATDSKPNRNQTETNSESNRNQFAADSKPIRNQSETNPESIQNQFAIDSESNRNQFATNSQPIQNQTETNPESIHNRFEINSQPIRNQSETNFLLNLELVTGVQRKILDLIIHICNASNSLITGPVKNLYIAKEIGTDLFTAKTAIQRLIKKGLIKREVFKSGKGGFSSFKISTHLKKTVSKDLNVIEKDLQLIAPDHTSSSSKITTTTYFDENETNNWDKVDIEPLIQIGFTKSHIKQLSKKTSLNPEMLQESINAFSFDLDNNGKSQSVKGEPLNFFMGILRKGIIYNRPANYESPQDRSLRIFIENQKVNKQEREKALATACDLACQNWIDTLSFEEVKKLIPEPQYQDKNSVFGKGILKKYFEENLWEKMSKEIFK